MKKRWISLLLVFAMILAMIPQVMAEQSSQTIPEDAVEFNGNHYKIYNDSMTWTEAKAQCERLGGRLVTITSQKEMDFLIGQLTNAQKNCYWIGIEYLENEGRWQLVTGTSVPYFNWAPNEPNFFEGNEENYVHLFGKRYTGGNGVKKVGDWNDVTNEGAAYANDFYALRNFGYICEWGKEIVASIDDLVEFNGHYYKLYHHTETWEDARDYCVSVGGHLATITSQEENDFLYQFIKDRSVSNAYFGLSDAEKEGSWKWVTNETLEYTNWAQNEPAMNASNENYGMFYHKYTNGEWNDGNFGQGTAGDNYPVHFICEWEADPSNKDLLIKFFPTGYSFLEDSYSFPSNRDVENLDKKYFTTMFENATGKLFNELKGETKNGLCFGMAYTTAAIYHGYPSADSFVNENPLGENENCSNIRDLTLSSKCNIGKHKINLLSYIRYAHIYQFSAAEQAQYEQTKETSCIDLYKLVQDKLDDDQIGITIGLDKKVLAKIVDVATGKETQEWTILNKHAVLAVGIEDNKILIDDPNGINQIATISFSDDGSWTYSTPNSFSYDIAWEEKGLTQRTELSYFTDVTMPYHILYTGTHTTLPYEENAVGTMSNEEDIPDIFVEGMERVDSDKILCAVESEGYQLHNEDILQIDPSILCDGTDMYWVSNTDTVSLSRLSGPSSTVRLASDDLLVGVNTTGGGDLSVTNDGINSNIALDTIAGTSCVISLETTGANEQDVILTISGTASDGTVTMEHTETGIDITGLDDSVITLTENEEVVDEKKVPNSDDEIHVEYDPTGNDDDVEIVFTNPFTDVNPSDYYYTPVLWALEKGITSGTSDTAFSPYESCLRSQVVTFLWRAAGKPLPKSQVNPFVDVKPTDYYYNAVLWAVENGITYGADDTHFEPNGVCNRSQAVTFLYRAFKKPPVGSANNPFEDVSAGDWYASAVSWAVQEGIVYGTSETAFSPNDVCNRSQVVTFLYRAYN